MGYRTLGLRYKLGMMKENRDSGYVGCRAYDVGQVGCRTGWMQERRDVGKEG